MGLKLEILKRSGAWFYYGEERIGQGRDNVKQMLIENKALATELEEKIMAKYNNIMNNVKEEEPEETITPVDSADIEPARPHKKIDIDIAVDE